MNKYPELRFECDSDEPPVVSREYIRFNGVGEDGYDTFYLEPLEESFVKQTENSRLTSLRSIVSFEILPWG